MKYLLTIINLLIIGLIYAQTPNNDLNWAPFWIDNFLISANPSLSLRRVPQGRAVAAWGAGRGAKHVPSRFGGKHNKESAFRQHNDYNRHVAVRIMEGDDTINHINLVFFLTYT